MSSALVEMLKAKASEQGMTCVFISQKTGIKYQRLMRLFNQGAVISGLELLKLSNLLKIPQEDLMRFVDCDSSRSA